MEKAACEAASPALPLRCRLLGSGGRHTDEPPALAFVVELHDAGDLREKRVVAADAHVRSGVEPSTPLANDDRATGHKLAGEALHAEHLGLRIAAVAR